MEVGIGSHGSGGGGVGVTVGRGSMTCSDKTPGGRVGARMKSRALDGGPQCYLSILRNGNVPCCYFF